MAFAKCAALQMPRPITGASSSMTIIAATAPITVGGLESCTPAVYVPICPCGMIAGLAQLAERLPERQLGKTHFE